MLLAIELASNIVALLDHRQPAVHLSAWRWLIAQSEGREAGLEGASGSAVPQVDCVLRPVDADRIVSVIVVGSGCQASEGRANVRRPSRHDAGQSLLVSLQGIVRD